MVIVTIPGKQLKKAKKLNILQWPSPDLTVIVQHFQLLETKLTAERSLKQAAPEGGCSEGTFRREPQILLMSMGSRLQAVGDVKRHRHKTIYIYNGLMPICDSCAKAHLHQTHKCWAHKTLTW